MGFPITTNEVALNEGVEPEKHFGKEPEERKDEPDPALYYQLNARRVMAENQNKKASFEDFYKLGALQALKDSGFLKEAGKAITVTNEPPKPKNFQRAVNKAVNTVKNPAVFA